MPVTGLGFCPFNAPLDSDAKEPKEEVLAACSADYRLAIIPSNRTSVALKILKILAALLLVVLVLFVFTYFILFVL